MHWSGSLTFRNSLASSEGQSVRVKVRHVLVMVKVRISLQEMHVSQCNVP